MATKSDVIAAAVRYKIEIDVEHDDLRPVNDLIKARLGRRVAPATLWRWRTIGVSGGIKLPMVRVGGIWHSTALCVVEWIRQQTEHCGQSAPTDLAATPAERPERTTRKLQAAGLL